MSTYQELMAGGLRPNRARIQDIANRCQDAELVEGYTSGSIVTPGASLRRNNPSRPFGGRFTRARPQRSPDRERSIYRRRTLAATWPMPPFMAGMLTTSQVAYARIVADEVHRTGRCDLTLDEIGARGGMCRKTAKRAQDRLAELRWIAVEERPVTGRKHLSNVVRIVSDEWAMWIKMGPKPRRIGGHSCPTTGNQSDSFRSERPKRLRKKVPIPKSP
ncbi:hypothetical protein HNQ71_006224 [Mesorhizobium sangaii]|uniref:Helix-turn-helix domain-containing protein n=1 Tax=Mesorhizobium sangaii TaxID=505389 RepID=A0A841PSH4_9HYPH|nr:hypothetical protein [Mesorhizobium sangaii]